MTELIKIENRDGIETVNARELHEKLQAGTKFSDWIKGRIEKYGFVENVDYVHVSEKKETSTGATISHEFHVTIEMAKELSMVENNEQGRQIRRYFIEVEKKAKEQLPALKQMSQIMAMMQENTLAVTRMIESVPKMVADTVAAMLPAHASAQPAQDYYSIMAYCQVAGVKKITMTEAKTIGLEARRKTLEAGKELHAIPDERFGKVNSYPAVILKEVFENWKHA